MLPLFDTFARFELNKWAGGNGRGTLRGGRPKENVSNDPSLEMAEVDLRHGCRCEYCFVCNECVEHVGGGENVPS